MTIAVRAGQLYRGRTEGRRARHVKIAQVRRDGQHQAYALAYEVTRSGNRISGQHYPIKIALTWDGRAWVLPERYEEVTP